jgi:hypothetical protein
MKYAVEMGLGAMIYMPNFINTASGIQNSQAAGDSISLLFFQTKESILKLYITLILLIITFIYVFAYFR